MTKDISADRVGGGADAEGHDDGGAAELIQLAAAVVPQPPIVLAQLGGFNAPGAAPQGPFVPVVPPGAVSATAGSTTAYVIGIDGTVRLPPGTVIDMAQVVGNDLHLMQPDGSLIVIVNGGVAIPLILVGNVAFGADVVTALLGLAQVQPAAAPAAGAGGVGSAGGEFGQPAGPIDPNPIDLTALLLPTALQFGIPEIEEIGFAIDDEPTVSENPDVVADDDDLSGGNTGGVGDDDATNLSGVLAHDFGDNLPGTISFLTTGAPAGFAYELSGDNLLILQNGTLVLTVTLDTATGAYTVTQNNPLDHAAGDEENNQDFTLTYRITDSDGDFIDGTLNIGVDDDTPTVTANATAVVDDDNLAGGNPGGAGDDEPASVSGTLAHSFGADGGSIVFLTTGAPAGFTYELSGSSLLIKQGATLVLTITLNTATGAYAVTQNATIDHAAGDSENNQAFTIGYRVTDGDGDTVDGALNISVDDDTPTVTSNATAILDDDQFPGGNPGGTGDDAIANTSGNIGFSFGADGAGAVALLASGAPAGFTYEPSGSSLLIKQGATLVLTVTLNTATGAYTVTQNAVIDHTAGGEENNSAFNLTYRVTDGDGDTVDGTLSISVDDDTPTVSSNPGVVVDEDDLPAGNADNAADDDAPANLTGTLGHSFGADGAGAVALLASGAPAGFTYTPSGGGTILTISQDSSGTDVLRITVNSTTGAYEVELLNPLKHSVSGTEDNLPFTVNYSVTDGDGDSVNGTLSVSVDDDLPTAAEQPRSVSATVLEDGLALASGDLSDGNREGGETTADDEASGAAGSLTGLFSVGADQPLSFSLSGDTSDLPTLYSKGDAVTYAVTGNVLTATADSGGPDQRVVFTMTVNADGSWSFDLKDQLDHVDNGLNDENLALRTDADGATSVGAIDFSSIILGTDDDGDSATAAPGSFTVAVQDDIPAGTVSGSITMHVDEDDLSTAAGDGDLSTGIEDPDSDEDEDSFTSASFSAVINAGADEPVVSSLDSAVVGTTVKTTLGADVTSQGSTVKWGMTDATHVFGFADVNSDGDYDADVDRIVFTLTDDGGAFTFDLRDQLDHAGAGDNEILTLDLTSAFEVTDFDGDGVSLSPGAIVVEVENDVPAVVGSATASIHVDEDNLAAGDGDLSTGIDDGADSEGDEASFSTASLSGLVTPGADEPVEFGLDLTVTGDAVKTVGGVDVESAGKAVLWGIDGSNLFGFADEDGSGTFNLGDRVVFTLTDNGDGSFTFDLKDQLDHSGAENDEEDLVLELTSAFTAEDADGDAVTLAAGTIRVEVENDVPAVVGSATATIHVDEDNLAAGDGDLSTGIDDGADSEGDEASFSTASLSGLVTPGADEPVEFGLDLTVTGDAVKTVGGVDVESAGKAVLWGIDGSNLFGFADEDGSGTFNLGDRVVFTLTDNGDGSFTFDLKDQLDHSGAENDEEDLVLELTSAFTAEDADGDAVTLAAGTIRVEVENDVPALGSGTVSRTVHEDALSNAQGDGNEEGGQTAVATGTLTGAAVVGADETGSFSINPETGGLPALTSKSGTVLYNVNGNTLTAYVEVSGAGYQAGVDRDVFTLTVNAAGEFTFTLIDQIDHLPNVPPNNDTQTLVLNLSSAILFTDFDGDSIALSDGLSITVQDDIPLLGTIEDGSLSNNSSASFSGDMPVDIGADEPPTASLLNNTAPAGLTSGGHAVHYYVDPADPDRLIAYTGADPSDMTSWVFTLDVDAGTDEYTFHIIKALDGTLETVAIGGSSAFGAGPQQQQVLDDGDVTELAIVSGWDATGFNLANWIASGNAGALPVSSVNGSTGGWGVDNNNFNGAEFMRFDFGDANDFDAGGSYTPPIFNGPATSVADFFFNNFGNAAHNIYVVVHYTDGTFAPLNGTGIFNFNTSDATLTITAPAGKYLDYVEFYANGEGGAGKVSLVETSVINEIVDIGLSFNVDITDHDGDTASGTIDINVTAPDEAPIAIQDEDSVPEGGQVVNAAFVLDFSGSIDNGELHTQLQAVLGAANAIFDAGAAILTVIIFSSSAANKGTFTDFASFQSAIWAMDPTILPGDEFHNPGALGTRPNTIGNDTDFTAAIQLTMSDYEPLSSTNNQVFFISDGIPNEQVQIVNNVITNSLLSQTAENWDDFIDDNDINVTTIGVGNGINNARLQDVDLDGAGTPILVADFDALLDTLLTVVGGDATGNVLANDTPGDGAFQIVSIEVDGVIYTYDGINITSDDPIPVVILGKVLSIDTALGGHLTFHFATGGGFGIGDWNYEAPGNVPGDDPVNEAFSYVIKDVDGDTDTADLVITVTPNTPPDAANDVVRTNQVDGTFAIPFSALMANDTGPNSTITSVTSAVGGTVALDLANQLVLFTPTGLGFPGGSFTYILENEDGGIDPATVTLTGVNKQQVDATGPGQILIGNDYSLYISITGDGQSIDGLNANDEEIFKWNGSAFSEYYGGGELATGEDAPGEGDIDALQVIPSGGILFSIVGDDEEFSGGGSNAADNEDIFVLFGPSDLSIGEVLYGGGDGSDTWGINNLNSLFQFSNGDLVLSFSVTTLGFQPWELVLYDISSDSFSEFANGMLSAGVIDAVDVLANGDVVFSLASDDSTLGATYEDSDLIRWDGESFSKYFDGSDQGLDQPGENIDGVSILGSDILVGGAGNDILMGLGGEDLLTGGSGNDTFVLTDALAADTITDYASGDAIDLSALLDQALIEGSGEDLSNFVRLTNQGPDRVLQIDANGSTGGPSFTTVAIFSPAVPTSVQILYDNADAVVPNTP